MDLGCQPPSNRYLRAGETCGDRHPLVLGRCTECALLQLVRPMPAEMVRARFDWLTYNEPEGHLDRLVDGLVGLACLSGDSVIAGVTYKDDSTLKRFERLGHERVQRLNQSADLGITDSRASLETIQTALTPERADELATRLGVADLLIVRHVLEHAHDPVAFLDACSRLTRAGGWMVFEMPDSRKFLDAGDLCFLWEEHVAYYTPATLRGHLLRSGFAEVEIVIDRYPLEDSLVAIVRNTRTPPVAPGADAEELVRGPRFRLQAEWRRAAWNATLAKMRNEGRRVAVFGAGHLAAKFINLNGLAESIACVIDDNPNKQHLRMPGSGVPVVGSEVLAGGRVDVCLLALNPESERKVLAANGHFVSSGGTFASIFALSPIALSLQGDGVGGAAA